MFLFLMKNVDLDKDDWIRRVRELDLHQLCSQHGAIFRDQQVGERLDWFEALEVGIAAQGRL